MNDKEVDAYIGKHKAKQKILTQLRNIVLSTGLEEEVKWGMPTYTLERKNIVGIAAFKEYVGLWFFQGVFLSDPAKILVNAQENKTKALRQLRIYENDRFDPELISLYIREAIQNQKEEKEIKPSRSSTFKLNELLAAALKDDPQLNEAYENFTPGRKKEFNNYIEDAKKQETRVNRLSKIKKLILRGTGLNDQYKV